MNHFIFEGFYDNILESFGWRHIQIGVPFSINLGKSFHKSRYTVEYAGNIPEGKSLTNHSFYNSNQRAKNAEKITGELLIYNPDKWGYSQFSFYQEKPKADSLDDLTLYEILHVSQ